MTFHGSLDNLVHGICTCYAQWLPGDPRGFRNRDHRIHSSGDYRNPPPDGEHEALHKHAQSTVTSPPVSLSFDERKCVGTAFLTKLRNIGCRVHVLACSATHLHVLYKSVSDDALRELGRAKQYSSFKLNERPGRIWGEGGKVVRIKSAEHAQRTFNYIMEHAPKEGAWLWRENMD